MWTPGDAGPQPALRPHAPTSHRAREDRRRARRVTAAIAALLALALLAPSASLDPFTQHLEDELRPPSRQHPCGQDKLGRDARKSATE